MDINQKLYVFSPESRNIRLTVDVSSLLQGDGMHNAGALLPELVESGIRVLLYAGQADSRKITSFLDQASSYLTFQADITLR